jgi:hypothetical protein
MDRQQSTKRQKHRHGNNGYSTGKALSAKHDLLAGVGIINSMHDNSTHCVVDNATESSFILQLEKELSAFNLITPIYTHSDAPTKPKPPGKHFVLSALITQKFSDRIYHGNDVDQFIISVKHPQDIRGDKEKERMQQTNEFHRLLNFLRDNSLAACLQPDGGRVGCIHPMSDDYTALVIYLPLKVVNYRIELLKKEEISAMKEQQRMMEYLKAVADDEARIEAERAKVELLRKALQAGRLKMTPVHGRFDGRGYLASSSVSMQRSEANSCSYVSNDVQVQDDLEEGEIIEGDDLEEGEIIDSQLASSTSHGEFKSNLVFHGSSFKSF